MKNTLIKILTVSLIILMNIIMPLSAAALVPLSVGQGGTGNNTFNAGECLKGNGAGALTSAPCSTGSVTSVSGTANRITSTGGATPAIDISGSYIGQSSITTLGTIGTGVWNGTAIANANLANSTISGISLGANLNSLTATNSSLTFSGSYNGSTARTVGLNLANANTWTGQQTFNTTAPIFGTITGITSQCLHVDTTGLISGTGSDCGSGGGGGVSSVASADGSITVTNPTTTVDLAVVKSPKLTTARTIAITGDLAYTSGSFDGTGNVTGAGTLATVNSNVGSFGSSTSIPTFTVNGKGLITAASGNAVIAPAGTLSGATLNSTVTASSLVSFGTNPSANNFLSGYRTQATAAGTTTLVVGDAQLQYFTGSTTQTVALPVVSTLVNGQQFIIANNSTGVVTVKSSGLNTIQAMVGSSYAIFTVIDTTAGTGTASWSAEYVPSMLSTNTASTLVLRDASGNFSAGTITANLTGTASAAPLSGITGLGTGVATALGVNVGSAGAFVTLNGALGTPSSGTGTNITGIPAANILAGTFGSGAYSFGTANAVTLGTIELGNASDTTLSRSAGGILAVEGVDQVNLSASQTLTNKTLTTPVINGLPTGTGVASGATASTLVSRDSNANITANNWLGGYSTTATAAGTTTLTIASTYLQYFTGSTTQTVTLPVVSTLALGTQYIIVNNSTGVVTVKSSGASTVQAMVASSYLVVTSIATTGTDQTVWAASYTPAATNANTASTLVLRDASGNFSAGTITAALTGNASTSTKTTNIIGGNGTTLLGALPYQSATDTTTLLSPNTTTTKKFLTMTGDGTNGVAPGWNTIAAGDVPTLNQNTTGTANIAGGGAGAIPYQSSANTTTVLAATGTANKILLSGASAAPVWSTPTFPNASASAGKIIRSDGTNWLASAYTEATPGASGQVMTSDGTNWTSGAAPTGTAFPTQDVTISSGTSLTDNTSSFFTSNSTGTVIYVADAVGGSSSITIYRLVKDAVTGNYYVTHSATLATGFTPARMGGMAVVGTSLYVNFQDSGPTNKVTRYVAADLTTPTAMTFSGTTRKGTMWSDTTNLWIYNGTTDQFDKFTISGTTITNAGATAFTSSGASPVSAISDGTSAWILDTSGGTVRKYAIAGGATSANVAPLVVPGAYYSGTNEMIFLVNSSVLGIGWFFNWLNPTTATGLGIHLMGVTLP